MDRKRFNLLLSVAPEIFFRSSPPTTRETENQSQTHLYNQTQKPPGKVLYTFAGIHPTGQDLIVGTSGGRAQDTAAPAV